MYISPSIIDRCIYYVNLLLKTINLYFRLIIKFLENLKFSIWHSAPQFQQLFHFLGSSFTFSGRCSTKSEPVLLCVGLLEYCPIFPAPCHLGPSACLDTFEIQNYVHVHKKCKTRVDNRRCVNRVY